MGELAHKMHLFIKVQEQHLLQNLPVYGPRTGLETSATCLYNAVDCVAGTLTHDRPDTCVQELLHDVRPQQIAQICISLLESLDTVTLRAKASTAIKLVDGEADTILLQALGKREACEAGAMMSTCGSDFDVSAGIAMDQFNSSEKSDAKAA